MRVISVNVGVPKDYEWEGKTISTAIFKWPVEGAVAVHTLNLEGDMVANPKSHGGVTKAVYLYPAEHYDTWRRDMPDVEFPWGAFGENLTTEGLMERDLCIGDTVRVGTAVLRVTEPRMPCQKLNVRFQRKDMVKRYHDSRTSGVYFAVVERGEVKAGDSIEIVNHLDDGLPLTELVRLEAFDKKDLDGMRRVIDNGFVPEKWRARFRDRIERKQG